MPSLQQNLYITYSNQKTRDLKNTQSVGVFDKVMTLDALILELFQKRNFAYILDETLASAIIYKIIVENKIIYFDYLQSDAMSMGVIFNFILKCHRNDVEFSMLLKGAKLEAITKIDTLYQAYKQQHVLVDMADIEQKILEDFEIGMLDGYTNILLDDFRVGNINFIKSKKQEEILKKLPHAKELPHAKNFPHAKTVQLANEVFDTIDEVKSAIKIARKLLLEGEKAEDILIVASDIQEYAPLYKLFLDEYKMKGYSSAGTPLTHFFNASDIRVQRALEGYKSQITSLEKLFGRLGLTFSKSTKESIKANIKIGDERVGIELTEPNQLIGLEKKYKHIIFIGTDINHFPPPSSDNFLYSYEDDVNYFHANNYFTTSQTHFDELKRLSEKLYIITASYSGKRELSRSILIGNRFDETIDVSEIKSVNDLALATETITPDALMKEYFESITSAEFTRYDGVGVEDVHATHLSASQINKYLSCPLAYLYSNKVKLQAPKQSEEGFDAMEQGSLMHLCFELFGREIQEKKSTSIDQNKLYELMYEKSLEAYAHEETTNNIEKPNIHHQIFLSSLQAGLKDERNKGLLAKFVDYYIENAEEFAYFQNSSFEKEFALDSNLKPYTLINAEDKNYFIKGFIDRFDELANHINIIDYKSKKMSSNIDKAKQEQVQTLKDVQLALYVLYASQQYEEKEHKAHLLSFKGENPHYHFANLSTVEGLKDTVHYSEAYNEELKKVIFDTKQNIETGNFAFNNGDETACGYCDMKFLCHESVLSKNNKEVANEL